MDTKKESKMYMFTETNSKLKKMLDHNVIRKVQFSLWRIVNLFLSKKKISKVKKNYDFLPSQNSLLRSPNPFL